MTVAVRVAGMKGFPLLMRALGHDPVPLLERCGLSEVLLADDDNLVPLQRAFDLLRVAVEATGLPDIGLRAAEVQDIGVLGPLALAMQNAPTIEASVGYLTRYLSVQSPALQMSLRRPSSVFADAVELRYDPAATGRLDYVPQVVDHGIALAHVTLRALAGSGYALKGVSVTHRSARSLPAFERFFGAPVFADQPFGALHFAPSMLAVPTRDARPALLRVAADYLKRHAPAADGGISARVRLMLTHSLPQNLADKPTVARMLGLHPRTLQRRLDAEGTNFDALRDEVRCQAALRYLADTDYALAQVAGLVGFSEQSAFTRFCRNKLGDTPRSIRARRAPAAAERAR